MRRWIGCWGMGCRSARRGIEADEGEFRRRLGGACSLARRATGVTLPLVILAQASIQNCADLASMICCLKQQRSSVFDGTSVSRRKHRPPPCGRPFGLIQTTAPVVQRPKWQKPAASSAGASTVASTDDEQSNRCTCHCQRKTNVQERRADLRVAHRSGRYGLAARQSMPARRETWLAAPVEAGFHSLLE